MAYDCTYSTPKSVSLLHALGPQEIREHVRAGHEEAAAAALGYLEHYGARVRRRSGPERAGIVGPCRRLCGGARSSIGRAGRPTRIFTATSLSPTLLRDRTVVGRPSTVVGYTWNWLRPVTFMRRNFVAELTARLGVSWRELQGAWAELAGIDPNLSPGVLPPVGSRSRRLSSNRAIGTTGEADRLDEDKTGKDLATLTRNSCRGWRERSYKLGVSEGGWPRWQGGHRA